MDRKWEQSGCYGGFPGIVPLNDLAKARILKITQDGSIYLQF